MERGYTVQEAAQRLGLSVKTVRKRIASGELRADSYRGPRGPQWRVWLDEDALPENPGNGTVDSTMSMVPVADPRLDALMALPADVQELQATLAGYRGTMERITASVESLTKEQSEALASERQKVIQLEKEAENLRAALKAELARPWYKKIFRR